MADPDAEFKVIVDDGRQTGGQPESVRGDLPTWGQRLRPWVDWFGAGRLAGATITVLAVVLGGWWLLRPASQPTEAGLPYAAVPSTATDVARSTAAPTSTTPSVLVVHVAGAVVTPGVFELPAGTRVDGAVAAAGGPLPDADPSALNLAAPLIDGERVYVPRLGEAIPPAAIPAGSAGGGSGVPAGPIDLNRATVDELDELPGVGPATAQAIVDHREVNGPFAAVDDLEAVRGIGPAKLDAIRDLVTP